MENDNGLVRDSRIYGLVVLYDMHTDFLKRALDGITDGAAQSRLDTQANHITWLTGSLVQQRFEFSNCFGSEMQQTSHELFSNNQGIKDYFEYPPLADFILDWNRISPVMRERIVDLDTSDLNKEIDMGEMKMSYFDWFSFLIYREANIIGQIALWRRILGYPALKYD